MLLACLNLIINLAALALWLNWWHARMDAMAVSAPATLAGTLKRTETARPKRWQFGAALGVLLLVRAWLYLQLSGAVNLSPKLRLGIVNLPFRADAPLHMLVYSVLSFGSMLGTFYLWMLLLSAVNGQQATGPVHKLVQARVKWVEGWPTALKLLSPFLLGGIVWAALHPLLRWLAVVPESGSVAGLLKQAAVVGVCTYLAWKYLILGVLLVHAINSQVYLGDLPVLNYVDITARNMLSPLRWLPLRAGRVDFLPLFAAALVFFCAQLAERPPEAIYRLLPF